MPSSLRYIDMWCGWFYVMFYQMMMFYVTNIYIHVLCTVSLVWSQVNILFPPC